MWIGLFFIVYEPSGSVGEELTSRGFLATYRVELAGFSLGKFQLSASFRGASYELKAKGAFSLLAGALYRASGSTTSTGRQTKTGPKPSQFELDYKSGKKSEQRRITFQGRDVRDVSLVPRKRETGRVPVSEQQLRDVLDPLTAAFLYARSSSAPGDLDVCHQTLPIFEGKQRFDIILTPKRAERLDGESLGAVSGPAAVCRAKFIPLGGYRTDHPGIKFMTETDKIEVWLVSLPETSLYLPYQILVPTSFGLGSVTLIRIKTEELPHP